MESLKGQLKAPWMAGNYGLVAKHLEQGAEEFTARLALKPGIRLLDVACGNGNLAMLAARARAKSEGLAIQFDEGDAEQLPYGNSAFDVVVSMFGAMFAPRPGLTAAELVRVCRPDGRIAMANWTPAGFAVRCLRLSASMSPRRPTYHHLVSGGMRLLSASDYMMGSRI